MDENDDSEIWPPKPAYNAQHDNKAPLTKRQPAGLSFLLGLVFYVGFWFLANFWDYVYGTNLLTLNQAVWFAWSAVFVPYLLLLMHKILLAKPWKDYRYCFLGFALGTSGAVLFYFQLSEGGVL